MLYVMVKLEVVIDEYPEIASERGRRRNNHFTHQKKVEIMLACMTTWVLGEDTKAGFTRGKFESPENEPVRDVVQGLLEVVNRAGARLTFASRKRSVKGGVVCELWGGDVSREVKREIDDVNEEQSGAEATALGNPIWHVNDFAEGVVDKDSGCAASKIVG